MLVLTGWRRRYTIWLEYAMTGWGQMYTIWLEYAMKFVDILIPYCLFSQGYSILLSPVTHPHCFQGQGLALQWGTVRWGCPSKGSNTQPLNAAAAFPRHHIQYWTDMIDAPHRYCLSEYLCTFWSNVQRKDSKVLCTRKDLQLFSSSQYDTVLWSHKKNILTPLLALQLIIWESINVRERTSGTSPL